MARFILSRDAVISRARELVGMADRAYYNLKTNVEVGKVVAASGLDIGLSVSSVAELQDIGKAGNVLFYLQGQGLGEVKRLYDSGITRFVADNRNDLEKILKVGGEVWIRVKMREHTIYTGKYFVYGFRWDKAIDIIRKLGHANIMFHRKTQNVGEWVLEKEFSVFSNVFDRIGEVNIGGGLPVRYANSNPDMESILSSIRSFREFLNDNGMELGIEPGRYIAAPAVRLETEVINAYDGNLIVDASIYNAYMDTFLFNLRLPVIDENQGDFQYLIKGCSMDSLDIFRYKARLPEKRIGDKVVFINAGAYNFHTEFSGLPRIRTEVVERF